MSGTDDLIPRATPFDGFLYAVVGEDRSGNTVSVMSALARLELDPWDEASVLSGLGLSEAHKRLEALLLRLHDIPALAASHGAVAQRLVDLLPKGAGRQGGLGARGTVFPSLPSPAAVARFGPMIALAVLILWLLRSLITGSAGPDF